MMIALSVTAWTAAAFGQNDSEWNVTSGNWGTGSNWTDGEPVISTSAFINNGGTVTIDQMGEICSVLTMGQGVNETGYVHMTGGRLQSDNAVIASFSNATGPNRTAFTQDDGTHIVDWGIYMSVNPGAESQYNLNGGTLNSSRLTVVGDYGSAWFVHTGGTHEIAGSNSGTDYFRVGHRSGSFGCYDLMGTGHVISTLQEVIGNEGEGLFRQTGPDTIHEVKVLTVGTDGQAQYELDAGRLINSQTLRVSGQQSNFIQNGGYVEYTVQGSINVVNAGRYELNGGDTDAYDIIINGGDNSPAGRGVFRQNSGIVNVDNQVHMRSGDYDLAGGSFNVNSLVIGDDMLWGDPDFNVRGDDAVIDIYSFIQQGRGNMHAIFDAGGISTIYADLVDLDGLLFIEDPAGLAPFGRFDIITSGSDIIGAFDSVSLPGPDWSWGSTNNRTLWVEHVPEPTCSMTILSLAALVVLRRKTNS